MNPLLLAIILVPILEILNTSLIFTDYRFEFNINQQDFALNLHRFTDLVIHL